MFATTENIAQTETAQAEDKFVSAETKCLYRLAAAYAAATNLEITTVSRHAANQGKFFHGLTEGRDVSTKRRRHLHLWFQDNWPKGVAWPSDIKRLSKPKAPKAKGKAA